MICNKVKKPDFEFGYDASKDEFVNIFELGFLDLAKVTCLTLQNALSIASMVLTTECIIVDKPMNERVM